MTIFSHSSLLYLYDHLLPQPDPSVPAISSLITDISHLYVLNRVEFFELKYHDLLMSVIESSCLHDSIDSLKVFSLSLGFDRAYVRSFIIDLSELLFIIYFSHPLVLSGLRLLPDKSPLSSSLLFD